MMDVTKDREVWRLYLELLPPQPSRKSGNQERKNFRGIAANCNESCNRCKSLGFAAAKRALFFVFPSHEFYKKALDNPIKLRLNMSDKRVQSNVNILIVE